MVSPRMPMIWRGGLAPLRVTATMAILASATPGWAQLDSALSRADSLASGLTGGARYHASMLGGYQAFATSTALRRSPFLAMRLDRPVGALELGANIAFTRPLTKGEYFPWNRQIYFSDAAHLNDTTLLFAPSQYTTLVTASLDLNVVVGAEGLGMRGGGGGSRRSWEPGPATTISGSTRNRLTARPRWVDLSSPSVQAFAFRSVRRMV